MHTFLLLMWQTLLSWHQLQEEYFSWHQGNSAKAEQLFCVTADLRAPGLEKPHLPLHQPVARLDVTRATMLSRSRCARLMNVAPRVRSN